MDTMEQATQPGYDPPFASGTGQREPLESTDAVGVAGPARAPADPLDDPVAATARGRRNALWDDVLSSLSRI